MLPKYEYRPRLPHYQKDDHPLFVTSHTNSLTHKVISEASLWLSQLLRLTRLPWTLGPPVWADRMGVADEIQD